MLAQSQPFKEVTAALQSVQKKPSVGVLGRFQGGNENVAPNASLLLEMGQLQASSPMRPTDHPKQQIMVW